jgi:hypothetical protein
MATLTDRDKELINLAVAPFKYPAARERKARDEFGLSGTRFWQEVNRILDLPEAHSWDPHSVARLKDRRTQRDRVAPVRRLL